MRRLAATFENSNGKRRRLSVKEANPNKTPAEIKASLEKLTLLNIFEEEGVVLFKKVITAKFVEKTETIIIDKNEKRPLAKPAVKDAPTESSVQSMTAVQERSQAACAEQGPESIQIPEDLCISEEKLASDILVQTVELPEGINPHKLTESQALALITACMPQNASLKDIRIEDQTNPAKIILTEQLSFEPILTTQSPPVEPKKKSARLIDRIKKRNN